MSALVATPTIEDRVADLEKQVEKLEVLTDMLVKDLTKLAKIVRDLHTGPEDIIPMPPRPGE